MGTLEYFASLFLNFCREIHGVRTSENLGF